MGPARTVNQSKWEASRPAYCGVSPAGNGKSQSTIPLEQASSTKDTDHPGSAIRQFAPVLQLTNALGGLTTALELIRASEADHNHCADTDLERVGSRAVVAIPRTQRDRDRCGEEISSSAQPGDKCDLAVARPSREVVADAYRCS